MKKKILFLFLVLSVVSCKKPAKIEPVDEKDWYAGGGQTFFDQSSGAFSNDFNGLDGTLEATHGTGDAMFDATFITAPSPINEGLGPVFNAVSCASCHANDGRSEAPSEGELINKLLLRISVPGEGSHGEPLEVPGFGIQFHPKGVFGTPAEGDVSVSYSYVSGTYADGTSYELRIPNFSIQNTYIPFPSNAVFSPRLSRPVFGLGLLEAIPDWALLANEDVFDSNQDGISGKANYVWDRKSQSTTLGRFGWKAGSPNLLQQVSFALSEDIGVTNFLFPLESSYGQSQYVDNGKEISDSLVYALAFYMKTLGVPARRNVTDPDVIKGKQLFGEASCIKCHVPKQQTKINVAFSQLSNQTIYPYTDLLLHDMGSGLADSRKEYQAEGYEWRTPPLWGIGLTEVVNGHSNFLHDGRARSLSEAILWHSGEAENAKLYFKSMSASDRAALIKFLKSL